MNEALSKMLSRYKLASLNDYENALKEIIQEISLLGLWRAKFYEHVAFYGGTALRIFYGLDRFSEDLDFSLLKRDERFDLKTYCSAIAMELSSFGLDVDIQKKEKVKRGSIESAFIKAGTLNNMIVIKTPDHIMKRVPLNRLVKVKLEVDVDPPMGFQTEVKYLLEPIPFSVRVYSASDLFAGKMHAILCREWKNRVKGRDWYDLVWFIGKGVPLNLVHLGRRMEQSGHLSHGVDLSGEVLISRLVEKIDSIDFDAAKDDVLPMLGDPDSVTVWSKEFFKEIISRLQFC